KPFFVRFEFDLPTVSPFNFSNHIFRPAVDRQRILDPTPRSFAPTAPQKIGGLGKRRHRKLLAIIPFAVWVGTWADQIHPSQLLYQNRQRRVKNLAVKLFMAMEDFLNLILGLDARLAVIA